MSRSLGYAIWESPEGRTERDTFTCAHCNSVKTVEPGQPVHHVGWCRQCDAPVCASCNAKGTCEPFESRMEADEARERLVRACGR